MKVSHFCMVVFLFSALNTASAYSQQYAITEDGRRVILHRNGHWNYLHSNEDHNHDFYHESDEDRGNRVSIELDSDIMLYLDKGQLVDFTIYSSKPRLYDNMTGKPRQIGHYEIEYDFHTERVKRIGSYKIDYDFFTDRVKQIGPYPIEYDFHTERISRIGNTYLSYSFFNGKLTDLTGDTPGVRITIY